MPFARYMQKIHACNLVTQERILLQIPVDLIDLFTHIKETPPVLPGKTAEVSKGSFLPCHPRSVFLIV